MDILSEIRHPDLPPSTFSIANNLHVSTRTWQHTHPWNDGRSPHIQTKQ